MALLIQNIDINHLRVHEYYFHIKLKIKILKNKKLTCTFRNYFKLCAINNQSKAGHV